MSPSGNPFVVLTEALLWILTQADIKTLLRILQHIDLIMGLHRLVAAEAGI